MKQHILYSYASGTNMRNTGRKLVDKKNIEDLLMLSTCQINMWAISVTTLAVLNVGRL